MVDIDGTLFCDQCGAEILLGPVIIGEMRYCCEDCAMGKKCNCVVVLDEDSRRETASEY